MKTPEIKSGLINTVVKRPVTVTMIALLIIAFGLFSLNRLKVNLLPSLDIPIVAVSISYSNVAPEDMNRLIVQPIEGSIGSVQGIETMESNVRQGSAFIILRLNEGANAQRVELDVREAIDRVRDQLPREATDPNIFQFDPESMPIMRMSINSDTRGLDELRQLSEELIEPRFERLPGVAAAETQGGLQRTVYLEMDRTALARHQIEISEITGALNQNNVQVPIGNLISGSESYSVRAVSMFENMDDIRETIVRYDGNQAIRVKDIAEVKDTFEDINTLVEVNGRNSVTIEIQKQSEANTLDVANAVISEIPEIIDRIPPGIDIQVLSNEGESIENSISNLTYSAMQALVLVVLTLFIFLGGWRSALIVAFSIPITMTGTFAAMYYMGISLNIISITGLALAVGLLVDNSIVVIDGVVAKLEQETGLFQAVIEGTNEVKGALVGSTLTTLGVFIPILTLEGMTGQIARDLALTICLAISISLLASILLIPMLASKFLKSQTFSKPNLIARAIVRLESGYTRILKWYLTHRWANFLLILAILGGIYVLMQASDSEFFPQADTDQLNINVTLPSGSPLMQTAEVLRDISGRLQEEEDVQTVVTNIGRSGWTAETHRGRINVTLVPEDQRSATSQELSGKFRQQFQYPGVDVNVFGGGFGGGGGGGQWGSPSVRVSLIGDDSERLLAISEDIEQRLSADTLVTGVDNPGQRPRPELHLIPDRQRINYAESSLQEVAQAFQAQSRGTRAGFYRSEGREIPIQLRLDESHRRSQADLLSLDLLQRDEQRITVATLGNLQRSEGMSRIFRRDRQTVLDLDISVTGSVSQYRQHFAEFMEQDYVLPDGYRYEFTGQAQQQQQGQMGLLLALLGAIVLTYMVMAALFENLKDPFVIMFTVPLAFFGSYFMLYLTSTPFSVPAGIGMVILIGIVVNNGIVMVDFIHQYTAQAKRDQNYLDYAESLIRAAKRRFRPIILTMLTTVGSMLPIALQTGMGSETWSPLAIAVIGGLIFASIFTLFIVPAIFVSFSRPRRAWFKQYKRYLNSSEPAYYKA